VSIRNIKEKQLRKNALHPLARQIVQIFPERGGNTSSWIIVDGTGVRSLKSSWFQNNR